MSDNATVTTQETNNAEGQVRTFTQDEVNAIVGKRLAEEKGKYADYDVLKAKADKFDEAKKPQRPNYRKPPNARIILRRNSTELRKPTRNAKQETRSHRKQAYPLIS